MDVSPRRQRARPPQPSSTGFFRPGCRCGRWWRCRRRWRRGRGPSLVHVGEVVEDEQAHGGQLLGAGEVADVVAVVAAARWAGAARDQRVAVARRRRPCAGRGGSGSGSATRATPWRGEPGRHGAVEDVEAEGDPVEQVVDLADAEQVLGRLRRQQRRGHRQHRRASPPCRGRGCHRSRGRRRRRPRRTRPIRGAGPRGRRPGRCRRQPAAPVPRAGATRGSGRASGGCARSSGRCTRGRRGRGCTRRRRGRCRSRARPAPASRPPARGTARAVPVGAEAHPLLLDSTIGARLRLPARSP